MSGITANALLLYNRYNVLYYPLNEVRLFFLLSQVCGISGLVCNKLLKQVVISNYIKVCAIVFEDCIYLF